MNKYPNRELAQIKAIEQANSIERSLVELSIRHNDALEKIKNLKNQCDYFQEVIEAFKDARDAETAHIYLSDEITINLAVIMDEINLELIDKLELIAKEYNID